MAVTGQQAVTSANGFQVAYDQLLCLQVIIAQLNAQLSTPMTAQALVSAATSYQVINSPLLALQVIAYLLANGAGGAGGQTGQIPTGNYAGGAPTFTPTAGTSILAIDNSTGKIWVYLNNVWTFTGVTA